MSELEKLATAAAREWQAWHQEPLDDEQFPHEALIESMWALVEAVDNHGKQQAEETKAFVGKLRDEVLRRERTESRARMEAVVARVRGWGRWLRYLYNEGLPGTPEIVAELLAYSGEPDGGKVLLTDDLIRRMRTGRELRLRVEASGVGVARIEGTAGPYPSAHADDPVMALRSVLLQLPAKTEPPPAEEQTAAPLQGEDYNIVPGETPCE